jgi:hypothetical protein
LFVLVAKIIKYLNLGFALTQKVYIKKLDGNNITLEGEHKAQLEPCPPTDFEVCSLNLGVTCLASIQNENTKVNLHMLFVGLAC